MIKSLAALVLAIENKPSINVFIWVLIPGGIVAGKLVGMAELTASIAANRPPESPGDQANLDITYQSIAGDIWQNYTAAVPQHPQSPGQLETFYLLYPRLYLGSTEVQPCHWFEVRLDAVSAWGHGLPSELLPQAAQPRAPKPKSPK